MTEIKFSLTDIWDKFVEDSKKDLEQRAHQEAKRATEGIKSKRKAKRIYKKVLQETFDRLADEFTKKAETYLSNEKNLEKFKKEIEWRQEWEERSKDSLDDFELQEREERKEFPFAKVYDSEGNIVKGELDEKANELYKQRYLLTKQIKNVTSQEKKDLIKKRQEIMKEVIKIQENNPGFRIVRTR